MSSGGEFFSMSVSWYFGVSVRLVTGTFFTSSKQKYYEEKSRKI